MTTTLPPELKGFHKRNMLHVFLVLLIPASSLGLASYRQQTYAANDLLQSILGWITILGIIAFTLSLLFKALIAKPKCPQCHVRMKQTDTINIPDDPLTKISPTTQWRIVECTQCDLSYRIPGLSSG